MKSDDYAGPNVNRWSTFEGIATFAIVAALLYFGAGIFVPLVLATLLAFALAPVVTWLSRRAHLPDPVAVIVSVLLALGALVTFSVVAGGQIVGLAQALPGYQETISAKIAGLQQQFGGLTLLDQVQNTIASLSERMSSDAAGSVDGSPIPVTISNELGPLSLLTSLLGSIIGPVATVAIVAVFLIFLLLGRQDLQDRFIRLVSAGRYSLTSIAINDASRRVGRYLIIQLVVNVVYGCIFAAGLWIIGVPSAPLWGLLIILFRYIPFVGALIIAVVPFLLAFAVDPGWSMLIWSVTLFLVLDLTTANVIEPRLYGSSTGVSPIAILLSAMFWAAIWGPVGLILATPMTVCLVVIGRHLPQLQFFETLLGSEPVLTPPERLYNRLLKGDAEGAIVLSDEYIESSGRQPLLDDVLLPVLQLAEVERSDEPRVLGQRRMFVKGFNAVVEEIAATNGVDDLSEILIIAGQSDIDECAARLVNLHLEEVGLAARVLPPVAIRQEAIGRLDLNGIDTVILVFLGGDIRAQSRYASRRLRRMAPAMQIIVCALHADSNGETAETLYADDVGHTVAAIVDAVSHHAEDQPHTAGEPVSGLSGAGRGDDELGQALDRLAERFAVPIASIHLLEDPRHRADADAYRLTKMIAETGQPLVIDDVATDVDVQDNVYLQTSGIQFYAGVPLVLADETCIGALVLMDFRTKDLDQEAIAALGEAAAALVSAFATGPDRKLAGRRQSTSQTRQLPVVAPA